jgi:hypothetical protein
VSDRGGVSAVLCLREHATAEVRRHGGDRGVAGDDPDDVDVRLSHGGEHVTQHRARERRPFGSGQHGDQALLGIDEVLDGNRDDDHGAPRRVPPPTTEPARARSCAASTMIVSVTTARTPVSASVALA